MNENSSDATNTGFFNCTINLAIFLFEGISFNQPRLCPNAVWYPNATTLANQEILTGEPVGLFIDKNNSIYAPGKSLGRLIVWTNGVSTPNQMISLGAAQPHAVFVTERGEIYVDNGLANRTVIQVDLISNGTLAIWQVPGLCYDLFVDITDYIYCSLRDNHTVIKKHLNGSFNETIVVAGGWTPGDSAEKLSNPRGIFVDSELNLYVADSHNHRIQKFTPGNRTGTTVVGSSVPGTMNLSYPADIMLDADGYFFISDTANDRIIGSDFNGYRCIVGCTGLEGNSSDTLNDTRAFGFDIRGNLYVVDGFNARIQKFYLKSNSCGK